jgi:peptidyl-prolyl cis-trans isomerase C
LASEQDRNKFNNAGESHELSQHNYSKDGAAYLRMLDGLVMPNEVHCAHILVKTEKEAQTVSERLKKGEKFANIASEVSLCPSRKRGGDLGTFSRGRMVKEFEQAAFSLQKGEISSVVKTKFGYHIIKRLE